MLGDAVVLLVIAAFISTMVDLGLWKQFWKR